MGVDGVTDYKALYEEYLQSDHWKNKRQERLEVDNFSCAFCSSSSNLHVHHTTYVALGDEDVHQHLVILCRSCHAMLHEYIKEYGPMYQKVIEETVSELRNAIDPISRKYVEKQSDILAVFLSQMDKTAWTKIQRIIRILLDSFPLRWREVPKLTYSYGSGPSIHVESIKKGAAMRRNKQKRGGSHD